MFYFFLAPVENSVYPECTVSCGHHQLSAGGAGCEVFPEGEMAVYGSGRGSGTEKQHQVFSTQLVLLKCKIAVFRMFTLHVALYVNHFWNNKMIDCKAYIVLLHTNKSRKNYKYTKWNKRNIK